MKRLSLFVFGVLLAAPIITTGAHTPAADDREAVCQAMLDYVEGIYRRGLGEGL